MIKSEIERITHYYYGKSRNKQISFECFKEISEKDNIKNLFEIYEDGYIGCWYYVIRKKGSSVALDYGINNSTLKKLMDPYMNIHNGKRLNVEELKLYRRGFYPAIHKVDNDYFNKHCDITNKKNNSQFNYLYTETNDGFVGLGEYNNIFYSYETKNEEELVKNLLNINVLSKNISEESVMNYVIDDRSEKNFEILI